MKIDLNNRKYNTISFYTIVTFAICLAMVIIVQKFDSISSIAKQVGAVLNPITWGIVIAYLGNPIMMFCEKWLKKWLERKKKHPKLCRSLSVLLAMIALLGIMTALILIIIPQIFDSVISILLNSKTYFSNIQNWINKLAEDYPQVSEFVMNQFNDFEQKILTIINDLQPKLVELAGNFTQWIKNFAVGIKDFLLGFIVCIYLLISKETFLAQGRKISYAILPKKLAGSFLGLCHTTNRTLSGFINGKLLDSFLIGMICFICTYLMNMPFAILISFIIGCTNIIPFFGPLIGAIPAGLLVLLARPDKFILFLVFILLLQQFDGNILGPKILGESTGLPAFWVMFSIFLGGGLFGFIGMLLCVPVFAVIYILARDGINALLKRKKMPVPTSFYNHPVNNNDFENFKETEEKSDVLSEQSEKAKTDNVLKKAD